MRREQTKKGESRPRSRSDSRRRETSAWTSAAILPGALLAEFVRPRAKRFPARERRHWHRRILSRVGDDALLTVRAPGDLTARRMAIEGVMRLPPEDRVLVLARLFRQEEEIGLS